MGNPNHDELGRFSEGDAGGTGDKTTDHVLAMTSNQIRQRSSFYWKAVQSGRITGKEYQGFKDAIAGIPVKK